MMCTHVLMSFCASAAAASPRCAVAARRLELTRRPRLVPRSAARSD